MGTPLSLNSKLLSLFTESFNVLVAITSEWQANKGVILYLWDAIDYSDLEQMVRMYFLGTFHQLEITVQERVSCSEESMHIMLQKVFLEPFISAQKNVYHGCPASIVIFFSQSSPQAGRETYCFKFIEEVLLVSWRRCWLSSHLLRSWSQTQHDCRCTACTGRFGMLTHS